MYNYFLLLDCINNVGLMLVLYVCVYNEFFYFMWKGVYIFGNLRDSYLGWSDVFGRKIILRVGEFLVSYRSVLIFFYWLVRKKFWLNCYNILV